MVRVMHDAGLRGVIVTAKEIFLRAHAHVGRGHRDIGVERQVIRRIVWNFGFRISDFGFVTAVWWHELARHFALRHSFASALAVVYAVVMALAKGILAH